MWKINLRVLGVTLLVIGFYTTVAHVIPQLQSEVPETLSLTGNVSPEALVAAGERVYNGAGGCTACHGLGTRAPNLISDFAGEGMIGARCGKREPGRDCKAYLYESLTEPSKFVVKGFEPIMPDMRRQLSNEQIWAAIAFLESQGGEVDVKGEDIAKTGPPPAVGGGAAPAPAGPALTTTMDPVALFTEKGCVACHALNGKGGDIGPPFDHVGKGRDANYIRRAILQPNADTAKGYEKKAGMMPPVFGQMLSANQLEAIVQFLVSKK
jgi:mono/diheme cytochrome c family protein